MDTDPLMSSANDLLLHGKHRALEEVVGYRWRNAGLAREACTHCSWPDSACPSYQRLEFLGDALIDLGVTHHFATTHRCLHACCARAGRCLLAIRVAS